MKFTIPVLVWLFTELVSVDARVFTESISRRDGSDLGDDVLLNLIARQDFDNDEFADLFGRSLHVKRVNHVANQQARNRRQQGNNNLQQIKNKAQQQKNTQQQTANEAQHASNQNQVAHNTAQNTANAKQQKLNAKQQDANVMQRIGNSEQQDHNKKQHESNVNQNHANQGQQTSNNNQHAANKAQLDHNNMQERLNTNQQTANQRQEDSNTAQKTSNTQQERDNQATRQAIEKSKPSKLDKCLDFASGACTIAAGAVAAVGAKRMHDNPNDPEAYGLAMSGAAATVAAGAFAMAKDPLKKCINGVCNLAQAAYNRVAGNRQQNQAHPPPTGIIAVRALARRNALKDVLTKRGLPASEVEKHVQTDTKHYLVNNLVRKSMFLEMQADILDNIIWS